MEKMEMKIASEIISSTFRDLELPTHYYCIHVQYVSNKVRHRIKSNLIESNLSYDHSFDDARTMYVVYSTNTIITKNKQNK